MEGILGAIIIVGLFVVFIVWARTTAGRAAVRNTLGDPQHSLRKRQRVAKRRATHSIKPVRTTKRTPR